jgi:hypothetical protein
MLSIASGNRARIEVANRRWTPGGVVIEGMPRC